VLAENQDVRFVVAGTGEKLRPLIESGAFRGLGGHFHFTGFLSPEKVRELLAMTDIYCMPSVSEPFGLSALEAAGGGRIQGIDDVLEADREARRAARLAVEARSGVRMGRE
jgi:glycosyltransferase involved in cell wall biosynthesis